MRRSAARRWSPKRRLGVPAHVDDDGPGTLGADGVGQLGALHARHDDVGEQQIDVTVVVLAQRHAAVPSAASTTV